MGRRIAWGLICLCLLTSLAQAQAERCTTETLQGRYLHYGILVFDGTGKFSGKQSSSRGGKIGREKLQGTYTLDPDCTGTMTFESVVNPGSQIHWDLYLTEDHKRGHIIRMDDGSMAVRTF